MEGFKYNKSWKNVKKADFVHPVQNFGKRITPLSSIFQYLSNGVSYRYVNYPPPPQALPSHCGQLNNKDQGVRGGSCRWGEGGLTGVITLQKGPWWGGRKYLYVKDQECRRTKTIFVVVFKQTRKNIWREQSQIYQYLKLSSIWYKSVHRHDTWEGNCEIS